MAKLTVENFIEDRKVIGKSECHTQEIVICTKKFNKTFTYSQVILSTLMHW